MANHVEVVACDAAAAHIVRNLYPLYLHDLSEFSGEVPNRHGVLEPDSDVRTLAAQGELPYQTIWWRKPGVLFPFLVLADAAPAGFALVATGPHAPAGVGVCVQEFFIVRAHRGSGVAERAAADVLGRFGGRWEVSVLPRNERAKRFWRRTIARHTGGRFEEIAGDAAAGALHAFQFESVRP